MNAQRTPDEDPELGWIECRNGAFDGEKHVWPLVNSDIVLSKMFAGTQLSTMYQDSGSFKRSVDGKPMRIFYENREATFTPPPPGATTT